MSKKLLAGIVLASLGIIYLIFDPALYPFFPRCPFYVCTGHYCPGCGSQRALHQIFRGNIIQAAGLNLLAVLYLPLIVAYYVTSIKINSSWHQFIVRLINKRWFIFTTLAIVLLFFVVRNTGTVIGKQLAP
jgi:hypothetical protein